MRRLLAATFASFLLFAAFIAGVGNASAAPPGEAGLIAPVFKTSADLSPELAKRLQSSTPKDVLLDADTGKILSVTEGEPAKSDRISPYVVTVKSNCNDARNTCWTGSPNYGFGGAGTKVGSWPNRGKVYTRSHIVQVCWATATGFPCSFVAGTNTTISWNYVVRGTHVHNYS